MDAKLFRKLEVTKVVSFISYINCIKCYFIHIKNNNLSVTTRTKCQLKKNLTKQSAKKLYVQMSENLYIL